MSPGDGSTTIFTVNYRDEAPPDAREPRLRALFEHALDAILLTSPDGRIHAANPAACRLYGLTEAEIVAAGRTGVLDVDDPRLPNFLEERRRTGAVRGELRSKRGDGSVFPSEVASAMFRGVDGAEYTTLIVRDLTERNRIEAEREDLARAKDEMVAIVSHELRTPLASLLGFAELLLTRDYPEEERREFLGIMLHETQRLTALINDFLDVQRLDSGRHQLSPEPTSVRALVERALAAAGDDPAHASVVDLPNDLPLVLADPDRIHQVLMNLVSNSRKYSPGGGPVAITARWAGAAVELSVTDQGLGIPPEVLPKLFEKFYRVSSSDRRDIAGTGLGLAIVKGLVEAHGGRVRAASEGPGRGSTFAFTLPVADGPAPRTGVLTSAEPMPAAVGDVLIVEDNPAYASWMTHTLALHGNSTRTASSAEEALQAVAAARPGVLLLDLRLGGTMDGWDLLAILRGRPETHDLPVVIISAFEEKARGQALDLLEYLVKPVAMDRLVAVIERARVDRGRSVLMVDDEPSIRRMVEQALALEGIPCVGVQSGEEALSALEAEPDRYALVVLDLGLPGIDGLAVLDWIRSHSILRDLPVVIFTARHLSDEEKQSLSQRAEQIVAKGKGVPIQTVVARYLGQGSRADAAGQSGR